MKDGAEIPRAERERYERLSLYMFTLAEFRYGYERLQLEPAGSAPASKGFYYHSLVQYLANLYLANGAADRFYAFLREFGLDAYADRIEAVLARKVGPYTFRERLSDVRDKLLVHTQRSGREVRRLKRKHDAEINREAFGAALDEILRLTHEIAVGAEQFRKDHGLAKL